MSVRQPRRPKIDADNPWPGLLSYDEDACALFNGRAAEVADLLRLIAQAPLTMLFGRSGLGKTSLLQAGLFPKLRPQNILPVYVRLDVSATSSPLIDQLTAALAKQIQKWKVDAPPPSADESLWGYLHRRDVQQWSSKDQPFMPLFVLDQFEEVFTLGRKYAPAVKRLRIDLADLVENRIPSDLAERLTTGDGPTKDRDLSSQYYKVLLSFREDFLPDIESWKRELPSILRNRLRLLPMSATTARQVVSGETPAGKTHQLVDVKTAEKIVEFVAAVQKDADKADATAGADKERDDAVASAPGEERSWLEGVEIEPTLLSLVCQRLNEERQNRKEVTIEPELLDAIGKRIIADFYREAVADVPEATRTFIENDLISPGGYRMSYVLKDALDEGKLTEDILKKLVDRRLLRTGQQLGIDRVELIHDRITGVVREHRDEEKARKAAEEALRAADEQRERAHAAEEEREAIADRQRRRLIAFGVLTCLLIVALVTSVVSWRRADNALLKAQAELLGEMSSQRAPGDRMGALLAAQAYSFAQTPRTAGALLSNLLSVNALRQVGLPAWKASAFSRHGEFLGVIVPTAGRPSAHDLLVLRANDLAVLDRVALDTKALGFCGFQYDAAFAVSDAQTVRLYQLDDRGRINRNKTMTHPEKNVSMIRCMDSLGVAIAQGLSVSIVRFTGTRASAEQVGTVPNPDGTRIQIRGLAAGTSFGSLLVTASTLRGPGNHDRVSLDVFGDDRHWHHIVGAQETMSCGEICAISLRDDQIRWYGLKQVYSAPVGDLAHPTSYRCVGCYNVEGDSILSSLFVSANYEFHTPRFERLWGLSAEDTAAIEKCSIPFAARTDQFDEPPTEFTRCYQRSSRYGDPSAAWSSARLLRKPVAIDRDHFRFAAPTRTGALAVFSTLPVTAPIVRNQEASRAWPDNYGFTGASIVVPTRTEHEISARERRSMPGAYQTLREKQALQRFDLDQSDFGHSAENFSRYVRIHDAGDGRHAATIDRVTGAVRVLDYAAEKPLHAFTVEADTYLSDNPQVAYDPDTARTTILSTRGLTTYDAGGHVLGIKTWHELSAGSFGTIDNFDPPFLTSRGRYVVLRSRNCGSSWLIAADGKFRRKVGCIYAVSPDESRVAAKENPTDSEAGIFDLGPADAKRVPAVEVPAKFPMALSPHGDLLAYPTSDNRLQLFDVDGRSVIGPPLPAPMFFGVFKSLQFSADSHYVVGTYEGHYKYITDVLTNVYSVSPEAWRASLCVLAGREFTRDEFRNLTRDARNPDGCSRYAAIMIESSPVPMPAPSKPPSPTPTVSGSPAVRSR